MQLWQRYSCIASASTTTSKQSRQLLLLLLPSCSTLDRAGACPQAVAEQSGVEVQPTPHTMRVIQVRAAAGVLVAWPGYVLN